MPNAKPTLGPWKVSEGAVYTEDGKPIARMVRDETALKAGIIPVERDANAHFIAAAPELLGELEEADEIICDLCKRVNPQHRDCTSCEERERRLAVIAKATGKGGD